jgi:hypothetical protein|tara:strand:+ start:16639 stop:17367 length:729 start_codon:yes stop_codon:yes gene_type:complete
MQDILQDIVSHTHKLGFITTLKINAEADTTIESMADDRSVIFKAVTHTPVGEFVGTFGMPDLGKLSYHLGNPEYKDAANIAVIQDERNGEVIPTHIHFENTAGDFENDYRFMNKAIIDEKLKSVKFKVSSYDVEIEPSMASIARMKLMAGAHSEETVFQVKTEDNNLNFYFGDEATHAGSFTFQHAITGSLQHTWAWPVAQTLAILSLDGDKKMSITDQGAMTISVDSGMAKYDYILPAQQK